MKKIVFGIVLCAAAVASAYIGPEQVTVSPDGKALYVTGASGACALVVDATTGAVLSRMELDGCQPTGVAVNRSNGDIYVGGSCKGESRSSGAIYKSGSQIGEVRSNGDVYERGSKIGEIRSNGAVYKGGSQIGEARNMRDPKKIAVIYFFGFF